MKNMIFRICALILCAAMPFPFAACTGNDVEKTPEPQTVENAGNGKKVISQVLFSIRQKRISTWRSHKCSRNTVIRSFCRRETV